MLRRVDVGRSQIGDQQMVAGEDVERQEAVVVVVAVEEASLLMAVHRIVGGVDVEHDLLGRRREGGDIGLDQNPVDAPGPGPLGPVLEAAQGRRAGQHPVALGRRLHGQVMAQGVMVVEVLVAQRDPEHPLAQHVHKPVPHLAALAIVRKPLSHRRR